MESNAGSSWLYATRDLPSCSGVGYHAAARHRCPAAPAHLRHQGARGRIPLRERESTGGIFLGRNATTGGLVFVDRFGLENHNQVILARSGAGKSYLAKLQILRSLYEGIEVLVIDPEDEYRRLAEAVGGVVVRTTCNFFMAAATEEEGENPWHAKTRATSRSRTAEPS